MTESRHLALRGCFNARDLGGLRTVEGGALRRGAVVRADALDALDAGAWAAVRAYGVRTIIDLRNDDERSARACAPPPDIRTEHVPIDNIEDRTFWDEWSSGWQFGTPLYYGPHLARFPKRTARALRAIARAPAGGVVFHCSVGRDRTGLMAILLLSLVGVSLGDIIDDYAESHARVGLLYAQRGEPDPTPAIEAFLAERGTSTAEAIRATLAGFDRDRWMRDGGFTPQDLATLRARVLA